MLSRNINILNDDREKVELYFSCRKLLNKDTFSKTDPQLFISYRTQKNKPYAQIHTTELISDNLNPDFTRSLVVDFIFEMHQFFKIECRDVDNDSGTSYDPLGTCEFELGELMGSRNNMVLMDLMCKFLRIFGAFGQEMRFCLHD